MALIRLTLLVSVGLLTACRHREDVTNAATPAPGAFVQDSATGVSLSALIGSVQAPDGTVWCIGDGFSFMITEKGIVNKAGDGNYPPEPGYPESMSDSYRFFPLLEDTGTGGYYRVRRALINGKELGPGAQSELIYPGSRYIFLDSLLGRSTNAYFLHDQVWNIPTMAFSASPHQALQGVGDEQSYFPIYYCFAYREGTKEKIALKRINRPYDFVFSKAPIVDIEVADHINPFTYGTNAVLWAGRSFYITTDTALLQLKTDGSLAKFTIGPLFPKVYEMFGLGTDTVICYDHGNNRLMWSVDGGNLFSKTYSNDAFSLAKFSKVGVYDIFCLNGQIGRIALGDSVFWSIIPSKGIPLATLFGVYKVGDQVYVTTTAGVYRKPYTDFVASMPSLK